MLDNEIIAAAQAGDIDKVQELLGQGANIDAVVNGRYPWTPLMHASFRGHAEIVRLLLERGATINHQCLDFFTAITLAAGQKHWDIVRMLAQHGADVNFTDGRGETVIDYAESAGQKALAAELKSFSIPE